MTSLKFGLAVSIHKSRSREGNENQGHENQGHDQQIKIAMIIILISAIRKAWIPLRRLYILTPGLKGSRHQLYSPQQPPSRNAVYAPPPPASPCKRPQPRPPVGLTNWAAFSQGPPGEGGGGYGIQIYPKKSTQNTQNLPQYTQNLYPKLVESKHAHISA